MPKDLSGNPRNEQATNEQPRIEGARQGELLGTIVFAPKGHPINARYNHQTQRICGRWLSHVANPPLCCTKTKGTHLAAIPPSVQARFEPATQLCYHLVGMVFIVPKGQPVNACYNHQT